MEDVSMEGRLKLGTEVVVCKDCFVPTTKMGLKSCGIGKVVFSRPGYYGVKLRDCEFVVDYLERELFERTMKHSMAS